MTECVFCRIVSGELPSWSVHEDPHVLAFLDINPVSEYHTLLVSKRHYEGIFDVPEEELLHLASAIKTVTRLFREKLGIENVQIVNSSGRLAQQDVPHLHFHIVPRHAGDEQDIRWTTHPHLRPRFRELLEKLK